MFGSSQGKGFCSALFITAPQVGSPGSWNDYHLGGQKSPKSFGHQLTEEESGDKDNSACSFKFNDQLEELMMDDLCSTKDGSHTEASTPSEFGTEFTVEDTEIERQKGN